MDYFENIIKTLLENESFWVIQSYKVELTKEEKRKIGKPSIPRTEIDLLAYKPNQNELYVLEAKSFLDSPGVRYSSLIETHKIPEGNYKLFTCENYRNIVFERLKVELINKGMVNHDIKIVLGLVAGNVYQDKVNVGKIQSYFEEMGWLFWSPKDVCDKVKELAKNGYENDASVITAKIILRNNGNYLIDDTN